MEDISLDPIINWDQTVIKYAPVSNWTQGSKRVEIVGIDDEQQITAMLIVSASGRLLPVQVIYEGKTPTAYERSPSSMSYAVGSNYAM